MRCPECNQRNSVAAKKCTACDSPLRRKPLPLALKIFLGSLVSILFVFWLSALSSTFNNPEKNLSNTATNLTSRSKSAEQMMGNIKYFDQAMRQFLQKYGSLGNTELSNKLSTCLPKSLYESHIFELLPNLKLVEIDTALNASNYLILLSNRQTEVLPIIGLDVYDSNSFLPQNTKLDTKKTNEGQLLVLLGHTADVHGHQPRVKVLLLSSTLQSDTVVDLTDSVVPKYYGEGSAKFSPNQKDIELSISLFSRGQELNVLSSQQLKASLPVENESLYEQLIWQNNAYSLRSQPGTSKLYALYATAYSLKDHNKLTQFSACFSPAARKAIEQTAMIKTDQGFTISTYKALKKNTNNIYVLKNDFIKAIVEIRPVALSRKGSRSNGWYVNSLSITKLAPQITSNTASTLTPEPSPAPAPQETIQPSHTEEKIKAPELKTTPAKIETQEIKTIKPDTPSTPAPSTPTVNNSAIAPAAVPEGQGIQTSFAPDLRANVKLRNGPGIDYQSIYEIQPNKPIYVIGKENGWYRVRIDGKEGFIYAGLVKNQKNNAYRNTIIKRGCNVRDDQRHIITTVRTGEHLVILGGPKNNRYKIMLSNGKTGYITREAVDGIPAESPPPSVP